MRALPRLPIHRYRSQDEERVARVEKKRKEDSEKLERQREKKSAEKAKEENEELQRKLATVSLVFPRFQRAAVGDRKNLKKRPCSRLAAVNTRSLFGYTSPAHVNAEPAAVGVPGMCSLRSRNESSRRKSRQRRPRSKRKGW